MRTISRVKQSTTDSANRKLGVAPHRSGRLKAQATDARSTLPDKTEISGANDLKRYLAQDRIDQVAFSFLKHLAIYGTGRSLTYGEVHFLKKDALKLKASGYRMKDMVRYVANSKLFLEK